MKRWIIAAAVMLAGIGPLDGGPDASTEKPVISRMLVANVWPGGYSEIYSLDPLSGSRVVSNIDFTVFEPAMMIETADAIYDFFILCSRWTVQEVLQEQQSGYVDARGFPQYWPHPLSPRGGPARFVPIATSSVASPPPADDEWRLVDLLHRYYQANRVQIEAQARQREIDNQRATAEEAARRALIPPHSGPPVIFKRLEQPSAAFTPGN